MMEIDPEYTGPRLPEPDSVGWRILELLLVMVAGNKTLSDLLHVPVPTVRSSVSHLVSCGLVERNLLRLWTLTDAGKLAFTRAKQRTQEQAPAPPPVKKTRRRRRPNAGSPGAQVLALVALQPSTQKQLDKLLPHVSTERLDSAVSTLLRQGWVELSGEKLSVPPGVVAEVEERLLQVEKDEAQELLNRSTSTPPPKPKPKPPALPHHHPHPAKEATAKLKRPKPQRRLIERPKPQRDAPIGEVLQEAIIAELKRLGPRTIEELIEATGAPFRAVQEQLERSVAEPWNGNGESLWRVKVSSYKLGQYRRRKET